MTNIMCHHGTEKMEKEWIAFVQIDKKYAQFSNPFICKLSNEHFISFTFLPLHDEISVWHKPELFGIVWHTTHAHTHSVYTFCQWLYVKHFMDLGKNVNSMNKLRRAFLCVITLNTHESRSEWICEYKIAKKFKFSNDDAPQNGIMEQTIPWDGLTTNVAKNFNWIPFNRMKYANRNYKLLFSRLQIDGQKSNLEEKLILMGISLASSFFETNLNNSCLTRTHVIWKFSTKAISGPDSHKN